jgi:hypothetical protein
MRARRAAPRRRVPRRPTPVFARGRAADGDRHRAERREFYTRAAKITRDARGDADFREARRRGEDHLGTLERDTRNSGADPDLESQPTFLFLQGRGATVSLRRARRN